jgi:hypothetical protein
MTPMLDYRPPTQYQLDREREYRNQRRFLWLALLAIIVTLLLAAEIARTDAAVDFLSALLPWE